MKRPAVLLAIALLLLSMCLVAYRIVSMGYPVLPTATGRTWQLQIDTHVTGGPGETILEVALPHEQAGQALIEEKVTSGALNFNILRSSKTRVGTWSGPIGPKEEEIVYQATILIQANRPSETEPPSSQKTPSRMEKKEQAFAGRLAGYWRTLRAPARIKAVMAAIEGKWVQPIPPNPDVQAWSIIQNKYGRVEAILTLLEASGLPARIVTGLQLSEGIETQPLTWIDVWTGQKWESLRPETGEIEKTPMRLLALSVDGLPAVRVSGGELAEVRWIVSREIMSHWRSYYERVKRSNRFLDQWSLFRLPDNFQATFRILLLVPIGALIIGFLRNVIGFPTFGVFMPVLLALAFRSTGLIYGLAIFAGILCLGYGVRSALDRLRLLLVPRMSVILTLVIGCFTLIALVGNKTGLRHLMAVGLLPFVILTMIIERFFIVIEESGLQEGLKMALGSAAVAMIAYVIISWETLQLTFFVFPELLLAVIALQILLGRYTGYRLSEAFRFRSLKGSP
ncbi:MAG TPA: UUP1 family membrane protein [Syntrophales bacterium]|nr:UUP1 family membrane protein [Syntrophales bacterium]